MKSAILVLLAASIAEIAGAQPAPVIEVASVKLHVDAPRAGALIAGNRLTLIGSTLKQLIIYAYDLKSYQYLGGPDWADGPMETNSYDVVVQGVNPALTAQGSRLLLQRVLAERFQLKVHHETKVTPVYLLVIAKGGPKFKESDPKSPAVATRGSVTTTISSIFSKQSIELLVRLLSSSADRPVFDRTGLTGVYDFKLEYARDPAATPGDTGAVSIFTAIQEQLGLKLDPGNLPIEFTIVDHAERPTPN